MEYDAAHPKPKPVLNAVNQEFLERVIDQDETQEGMPSLLPTNSKDDDLVPDVAAHDDVKHKEDIIGGKEEKKSRISRLLSKSRRLMKKKSRTDTDQIRSTPYKTSQEEELAQVLDDLNFSTANSRAFSISKESTDLVQKFTLVLKDLINGVPTAYNDLTHLLDSSNGTLNKSYENLPVFLKKMITQLLDKVKNNMGPEIVAATAGVPGMFGKGAATAGIGFWEAVAKPQAVVTLLREILLLLRLRWPAFMATNVLLSVAIFMLLLVLWYCHKRGKEERLIHEAQKENEGRVTELDDNSTIHDTSDKATV
ncbi:hypothetical protein K3495_g1129 [Podosphaera aphanis]|nr:hypothetical protein K3495_g1129 [Podosphaera aphanis]